jgi:hypothetical protein
MSAADFIPRGNPLFNPWQLNLVERVNAFKASWAWDLATTNEWKLLTDTVDKKKLVYDEIWAIVSTKKFTHADEQKLKTARKDYESGDRKNPLDTSIRLFINRHIRFNPLVTDDQKRDMQLTVPDTIKTPTPPAGERSPEPELAGSVKRSSHLQQQSAVAVPGQKSKAKGKGVDAIEVFLVITGSDVKETPELKLFQLVGEVQRGYYTHTFDIGDEGKRAWYYARRRYKGKTKTYGSPTAVWSGIIF